MHGLIAQSAKEYPLILSIGGDGTTNQIAQRLDLLTQTLIVLPSGRGNDLARALGMPRKFSGYLRALPRFHIQEIDVWKVEERRFLNSLGIGLDTQVLETMAKSRGLLHSNYMASFLATLPRLKLRNMRAACDGKAIADGPVWWLVAMNSENIGGGLPVTPNADLSDGKLDVMVFKSCTRAEMLLKLPKLYLRTHLSDKRISHCRAEQLDLAGLEVPVTVGVDGELTLFSSKELRVRHAGKLMVACATADTL